MSVLRLVAGWFCIGLVLRSASRLFTLFTQLSTIPLAILFAVALFTVCLASIHNNHVPTLSRPITFESRTSSKPNVKSKKPEHLSKKAWYPIQQQQFRQAGGDRETLVNRLLESQTLVTEAKGRLRLLEKDSKEFKITQDRVKELAGRRHAAWYDLKRKKEEERKKIRRHRLSNEKKPRLEKKMKPRMPSGSKEPSVASAGIDIKATGRVPLRLRGGAGGYMEIDSEGEEVEMKEVSSEGDDTDDDTEMLPPRRRLRRKPMHPSIATILQLVVENGMLDPTTVIACIGTNNECRSTILVRLSVLRHVPLPFSLNSVTKLNRRTFDHLFPFTAVDGAGLLFYYHPRPRWGCLAKDARREREVEEEENDAGGSERGDNTGSGGEGDESGANENYGSRTAHQRDYLAGEEKVLLKLFNETDRRRGCGRFEKLFVESDPDRHFRLDHDSKEGLRLRYCDETCSRSYPRLLVEAAPSGELSYGCLLLLDIYRRSRGSLKRQIGALFRDKEIVLSRWRLVFTEAMHEYYSEMNDVTTGTVIYRWEWTDPQSGITYYDIGYSTNARRRLQSHKGRPVNRRVLRLVEKHGMKWDDVRSSVIFHLSSRAPAALGFPVESILNAFFGATDSSGPRFSGLNINLLDNAHGVPALSKSEYNEIWDWAVSFYRLHQNDPSKRIPKNFYDSRDNTISYPFVREIIKDPEMAPTALYYLLTGIVYPRYARRAHKRNPMPGTAFHGIVPFALRSLSEQGEFRAYEEEVNSSVGTVRTRVRNKSRVKEFATANAARREEEDEYETRNEDEAATFRRATSSKMEQMKQAIIDPATSMLSSTAPVAKKKSHEAQEKLANVTKGWLDFLGRQ